MNGYVSGNTLGFTYADDFRPVSWYAVNIAQANGSGSWNVYTFDGMYNAYLPPGNYRLTVAGPGFTPQTLPLAVSSGQSASGLNVYLQQSNIPVPEFHTIALVTFSMLAVSLYFVRRRRH